VALTETEKEQFDASIEKLSVIVGKLIHSGLAYHAVHKDEHSRDLLDGMIEDARVIAATIVQLKDLRDR
jgi:hypothetical protein